MICWRKLATSTVYNYIDRRTGQTGKVKEQSYCSSAMQQLMSRIAFQESHWCDTSSVYVRPDRLRLRTQLRSCKLKCEMADKVEIADAVTMVKALSAVASKSSAAPGSMEE